MTKKVLFTLLFLFTLLGLQIASFKDWLILSFVIQILWLTITSNDILKLVNPKNRRDDFLLIFNKIFIYLLIADLAIIFLSTSFGFRVIFAPLYRPLFYISAVCAIVSLTSNYFTVINYVIKMAGSNGTKFLLAFSSLVYPIGVYTINLDSTSARL